MMTPNYDEAANRAMMILLDDGINSAPVDPIHALKTTPDVIVVSYAEMALDFGIDRNKLLKMFSKESFDSMTYVKEVNGVLKYCVIYNQRLPIFMVQRSLARELGHIILNHDGSLPENVRMAEARAFAHHFICPRPLIKAVMDSGIRMTTEVLGNMTGCYERCLAGMREMPGARVRPELNRLVRERFSDYLSNFIEYQSIVADTDKSQLADFGTYMDNYEE